jgi:hypothetical protein
VIRHIDDYYQFFGHKYFLEEVANLFLQKINSNYNYVRFLFIDMFTLLYKLSNNSLEGCMRSFINTVYNHHHLVVIKVLSVFVALLSDKEIVLPKENAEEIIIAIVGGSACVFPSVRCCCTRTPPFATR